MGFIANFEVMNFFRLLQNSVSSMHV